MLDSALGAGGRPFLPSFVKGLPERWTGAISRNVTAHREQGLGAWSDAEIKRAITQGIGRDGRRMVEPMAFAWYAGTPRRRPRRDRRLPAHAAAAARAELAVARPGDRARASAVAPRAAHIARKRGDVGLDAEPGVRVERDAPGTQARQRRAEQRSQRVLVGVDLEHAVCARVAASTCAEASRPMPAPR